MVCITCLILLNIFIKFMQYHQQQWKKYNLNKNKEQKYQHHSSVWTLWGLNKMDAFENY